LGETIGLLDSQSGLLFKSILCKDFVKHIPRKILSLHRTGTGLV